MGSLTETKRALESRDEEKKQRDRIIVRTSIIGIAANVFLALFKAVVGIMSHSIAIVLDAVNNISDAGSSLITIVGTKLAGKDPDRKHPFGYGRIEYLTAMIISVIVLYAGITSLTESIKKIIEPEVPDYTGVTLVIVAVAVVVKIVLGRFVKKTGEAVNSDSLINSGADATLDAVISASTLVATVIFIFFHVSLEAWLGAVISIVIIKSGLDMLKSTLSEILGERAELDLVNSIKKTVKSFPDVSGAYDLVLNNYGPDTFNGSIHIEVPDSYSADELDDLIRRITAAVFEKHHVILTAVGVYSINTKDTRVIQVREDIRSIVMQDPNIVGMHGFYISDERREIRFDMVFSFNTPDRKTLYNETLKKVQEKYPGYELHVAMDSDFTET
ncbi:cation diffusion facilitator family transporter [Lachnospiraceae bacterium]|nr:cation diffusion facilitator family transporter [Lachnospiraceae bacterium]